MGWFFETPVLPSLSLKRVMSGCDCCGAKFLAALHHGKTSGRASFLLKRSSRACNSQPRFPCSWRGKAFLDRKSHHIAPAYPPFLCLYLPFLIFLAQGLMPSNAFPCFCIQLGMWCCSIPVKLGNPSN